jgi:phosphoadenosine phosphosulfate reductase
MLKKKEIEAIYFLRSFPADKVAVSFSGGKDSLVALHLAMRAGIKRAVFSDTTIESQKVLEYVKEVELLLGIKIDIIRPRKTFWELAYLLGPPSVRNRWCCPTIKFQQLNEYAKKNDILYYVTGLRRSESHIRKNYQRIDKNPMLPNVIQLNPIIDWSEKDVWDYINKHELPIPPGYLEGLIRNGCTVCPYKSQEELEKVKKNEPEIWKGFEEFLNYYADNIGVPNKKEFVEGGWKLWRPPIKRKIVGKIKLNNKNNKIILTNGLKKESFKLLKILKEFDLKKAKILIEKELNCIGCGACLSLCPTGALYINGNGLIDVNIDKCIHCYECLRSKKLRGGCIGRNYKLEIFIVDY